jgi:hypothetical protein
MDVQPCTCIPVQWYFVFVAGSVMLSTNGSNGQKSKQGLSTALEFWLNVIDDYSIVCEECSLTYQPVEVHIPLKILLPWRANLFSFWLIVDCLRAMLVTDFQKRFAAKYLFGVEGICLSIGRS